jgi:hypothetical protein
MIRGETHNLLIAPRTGADVDPSESFAPHQLALYNGRLTSEGNWRRRPGFQPVARPASLEPIFALIPDGLGFAVARDGRVYRALQPSDGLTVVSQRKVQALVDRTHVAWAPRIAALTAEGWDLERVLSQLIAGLETRRQAGVPVDITDILNAQATAARAAVYREHLEELAYDAGTWPAPMFQLLTQIEQEFFLLRDHMIQEALDGVPASQAHVDQAHRARFFLYIAVLNRLALDLIPDSQDVRELTEELTEPLLVEIPGHRLAAGRRPTWANYDGTLIIANGELLAIAPNATVASFVNGGPPAARFVVVMDSYVVLAGWDAVTFRWSSVNTMDEYPVGSENQVLAEGEEIRMLQRRGQALYFFKDKSIEVWVNVGGDEVWARQGIINRGTPAGYSVVLADDTFYWFANRGEFCRLNGNRAEPISKDAARSLSSLVHPEEIYGLDFPREHVIRWFAPSIGRTWVFDYEHNLFSEDYAWRFDERAMLPIAAYMELGGHAYVGGSDVGGYVSEWSEAFETDAGETIRVERQLRTGLSADATSARVNRLRLRLKRGASDHNALHPSLMLRWALDEAHWTPYELVDLGAVGEIDPYIDFHQLGIGNEIRLELIETGIMDTLVTYAALTSERLGR